MSESSQVRHPWRATIRTTVAALVATGIAAAPHIGAIDWSDRSALGLIIASAALITRVMADPRIERLIARILPALSADPENRGTDDHQALRIIDRVRRERAAADD